LPARFQRRCLDEVTQGGPTFFFLRAKNCLPVEPKGQENPPGNIFEK
jgi:hypothetical protein